MKNFLLPHKGKRGKEKNKYGYIRLKSDQIIPENSDSDNLEYAEYLEKLLQIMESPFATGT